MKHFEPDPFVGIRNAVDQDCHALTDLCTRSKAIWGYDSEFMQQCKEALTLNPNKLQEWTVRVAFAKSGQPLGVAAVRAEGSDARIETELELLFVEPKAVGHGIGRALLVDMHAILLHRGVSRLWILSDPGAEAFYLNQGATRVGLRPSDVIPGRQLPWLCLELRS